MRRSQYGQDELLDAHFFREFRGGVFLDVGANDGLTYSNTALFEFERGWIGICIEPNPSNIPALVRNRPHSIHVRAAVAAQRGTRNFIQVSGYHEMLSGLAEVVDTQRIEAKVRDRHGGEYRTIPVETRTLNDILKEQSLEEVHYLTIDIEGGEAEVLRSFDFNAVRVHAMTVECNSPGDHDAVLSALNGRFAVAGLFEHDLVLVNPASQFATNIEGLSREIRRRMWWPRRLASRGPSVLLQRLVGVR